MLKHVRNGTFTNTQDQPIQGCFGRNQTPNTEHSSRNRDIHILTITLLSHLIRKDLKYTNLRYMSELKISTCYWIHYCILNV